MEEKFAGDYVVLKDNVEFKDKKLQARIDDLPKVDSFEERILQLRELYAEIWRITDEKEEDI